MAVKRYNGSSWDVVAGVGAQGAAATSSTIATWVKTASGGETSVSGNDDNSQPLSYTIGQELVFINGVLQKRGADYTANTGNSITGLSALTAGDIVSVWTVNAFSVSNAIANTIVDAKGDILVGTGADTPGILSVGTNGQVLTAASTTGTGLAWTTLTSGPTNWTLLNTGGTALTGATKITVSFTAPKQLLVLMVGASSVNSRSFITIRPNDVSTADYSIGGSKWIYTDNFSTTVSNSGGTGAYSSEVDIPFGTMGTGTAALAHGTLYMDLTDKTGNKYYNVQAGGTYDAATAGQILYAAQGLFESSSTITSIAVLSSTGNFDAGTLYIFGAN